MIPTEPSDNWTIEQGMHWWLLQAHAESDAECNKVISSLSDQLEKGKESLWEDHKQVKKIVNDGGCDDGAAVVNNENSSNSQNRSKTTKTNVNTTSESEKQTLSLSSDTIRVDIIEGEYDGMFYELHPKARVYAWVGRSQGQKFRDKGISLPRDLEVSTTHGRFELKRGKFFYVDTGSTNGSMVGDMEIEPNAPVELESGMTIRVGQTVMKVTVPY